MQLGASADSTTYDQVLYVDRHHPKTPNVKSRPVDTVKTASTKAFFLFTGNPLAEQEEKTVMNMIEHGLRWKRSDVQLHLLHSSEPEVIRKEVETLIDWGKK